MATKSYSALQQSIEYNTTLLTTTSGSLQSQIDTRATITYVDTEISSTTALIATTSGTLQSQITSNAGDISSHTSNTSNPHSVTASQVGLGNVDNTSDLDKPVSTATESLITTTSGTLQTQIDNVGTTEYVDNLVATTSGTLQSQIDTNTSNISTNTSNISSNTSSISQNTTDISTVSGTMSSHISNTSNPHSVTAAQLGAQLTSEKGNANGYASLDASAKVPTSELPSLVITDVNVVASEAAQLALTAQEGDVAIRTDENKSYIHNGGVAGTMADWNELLTPTDSVQSVNGYTGVVVLDNTDIGLGNVENLSITTTSGTLQTQIDNLPTTTYVDAGDTANANLIATTSGTLQSQITSNASSISTHTSNTSNPHSVTKDQVGLGAVENLSITTTSGTLQTQIDNLNDSIGHTQSTATTISGTYQPDPSTYNYYKLTAVANTVITNPTTSTEGQEGRILVYMDSSGGHSVTFSSDWRFAYGQPEIDTNANAINVFEYSMIDTVASGIQSITEFITSFVP